MSVSGKFVIYHDTYSLNGPMTNVSLIFGSSYTYLSFNSNLVLYAVFPTVL